MLKKRLIFARNYMENLTYILTKDYKEGNIFSKMFIFFETKRLLFF